MSETETKKREPKAAAAVIEPESILDLGFGLELWKAHPSSLREQDVNARAMPKAMFERLAQTIARDKRLESLPLCAKTERGLEIISGHHRVRAATAAGISEMFVLVDVTGLTHSQIAAKQLAHNAIEGQDNDQLLAEIYRQIEDAESKLEAFIDEKLDVEIPKVKIEGLDVEIDFKTVLLIFLPRVKERLDRALEYLRSSGQRLDGVYIAADSDYAPLEKAVRKIHEEYDVRVVADIIGKLAQLAMQASGVSVEDPERVHLKDLFGSTWVPKESAKVIRDAVQKMLEAGELTKASRWQALEYWAADYLASGGH
ncbi:MAG: ParB N-terminal domain-containing protein [Acidobacteriia bacterium]|nr:ParB N-terminal domain-containing protein [Terriglobia bacterium]